MKRPDLRLTGNPQILTKLPRKPDDAFSYLYEKLIEQNEHISKLADKKECGPYDEPVRKKLRPAQQVLVLMLRLDSQILNGGVTQFIWNAPFEIDDVEKAIKKLGLTELAKIYKKVDDRLMEKMDEWVALRQKWNTKSDWEDFQKTYALLDLDWFDKAYMAKHRSKMVKALIAYVVKHKADFVKPDRSK
jgi:hypothetical protein